NYFILLPCISTFVPSSNQHAHAYTYDKNHLVFIKVSQVTVPCHHSQTIMTAPTSFAITSSFPGSHRVPTPLTLKRPVMAAPTSLKKSGSPRTVPAEIFFPPNRLTRSPSLAHARHAGPTTGPCTAAGITPCHPLPRP